MKLKYAKLSSRCIYTCDKRFLGLGRKEKGAMVLHSGHKNQTENLPRMCLQRSPGLEGRRQRKKSK